MTELTYINYLYGFSHHFMVDSKTKFGLHSIRIPLAMYDKNICGINFYDDSVNQEDNELFIDDDDPSLYVEQKIMGGDDVDIAFEPWSVQIYSLDKYICGGTLVSRNYIMTAAHCIIRDCRAWKLNRDHLRKLEVLINFPGDEINDYLDKTLEGYQLPYLRRRVRSIVLPSLIDSENIYCEGNNDFAILELNEPIPEGYGYACIPIYHPPMYSIYTSEFYVIGYGRNPYREAKMMPTYNKALQNTSGKDIFLKYNMNKIQKLEVGELITYPACRLKPSIPADEGYICVYDKVDEGICDGDSGSGLFKKHKNIGMDQHEQTILVGIVSKAVPCSERKDWVVTNYQLYTDVYQQINIYEKLFQEKL